MRDPDRQIAEGFNWFDRNSGHGWVIPRPDGEHAPCGGPGVCPVCDFDAQRLRQMPLRRIKLGFVDVTGQESVIDDRTLQAKDFGNIIVFQMEEGASMRDAHRTCDSLRAALQGSGKRPLLISAGLEVFGLEVIDPDEEGVPGPGPE
jgi:hypothetical protein